MKAGAGGVTDGDQFYAALGGDASNSLNQYGATQSDYHKNQTMPRKYSNFDKNGMRIINGNSKESQTQISGPVIQSDLTESLFNKIDELEKQAAQLQDLKS